MHTRTTRSVPAASKRGLGTLGAHVNLDILRNFLSIKHQLPRIAESSDNITRLFRMAKRKRVVEPSPEPSVSPEPSPSPEPSASPERVKKKTKTVDKGKAVVANDSKKTKTVDKAKSVVANPSKKTSEGAKKAVTKKAVEDEAPPGFKTWKSSTMLASGEKLNEAQVSATVCLDHALRLTFAVQCDRRQVYSSRRGATQRLLHSQTGKSQLNPLHEMLLTAPPSSSSTTGRLRAVMCLCLTRFPSPSTSDSWTCRQSYARWCTSAYWTSPKTSR